MANTVKTDTGVEVYENDIYRLSDEYIDTSKFFKKIKKAL